MRFWVFDRPMMIGAWAFADVVDASYGDAPRCTSCGTFIGMRPWLPPYRVRLVKGTKTSAPADVITGPGFDAFLASQHFVDEFERANLKGIERWETVDIEGYNTYEGDPTTQAVVDRTYNVAILPEPKARARLSEMHAVYQGNPPSCQVCGADRILDTYEGVVVDEESWSGDDIARLTNLGHLIVSDRFADFIKSGEFTGIPLVPAELFRPFRAGKPS